MADVDAQLAVRAARGDLAALEVLYRRHVDRVWRYAWHRTYSRDDAAEIVQEVFLRVTRSIGQFKRRSTFSTWLFAVVRSTAIELARRQARERAVGGGPAVLRLINSPGNLPGASSDEDTRDAVRRAVAELPGAKRDAVVLCELSGLSIKEAGNVLGWSESRVKVTLFRARRNLRDRLREYVTGDTASGLRDQKS